MIIRKLSALLVSFSLAWVPVSMSFASTVAVEPVATEAAGFGNGGFGPTADLSIMPSSVLLADPVITLNTDPVTPYRRGEGPVLSPSSEIDYSSSFLSGLSYSWNWMTAGPSTDSCLNCTISHFWQNQRTAYPNLTRPLSYFDDYFKFTAASPVASNQCLINYDSTLVDNGENSSQRGREPSTELCFCLKNSEDTQAALAKEDIDKFGKLYEAEAIENRKKEFANNKERMIEDFAQLRAALYYDKNFNRLSESYYGSNSQYLEEINPCLGDLESLMNNVQTSDPQKSCGAEGVQEMVNLFEGASIGLAAKEVAVNPKDSPELQTRKANLEGTLKELESQMREKSVGNLDIFSTLSMFRSLNVDPEVLKQEFEKSKSDSSIDISEILRNTLDRTIQLSTQQALESRNSGYSTHNEHSPIDLTKPHEVLSHNDEILMSQSGSQVVATQNFGLAGKAFTAIEAAGSSVLNNLIPSLPINLSSESPLDKNRSPAAVGGRGNHSSNSHYSNLSAEEKKLVDNFNLFISSSPSIRGALKSNFIFDDLGQNSHMVRRMLHFGSDKESSSGRMTAFISSVCSGETNSNLAICTGKFDNIDMKTEMDKFSELANIKASVNLNLRCKKVKDKLLNTCRAFSNVKPPLSSTDARSFLYDKYLKYPDANITAANANEHKMKVAQLSCYFTMRDRAIAKADQNEEENFRCNEVENKFLKDETAKKAISSNKILGEGCKGSGTPSIAQGAVGTQGWAATITSNPGKIDAAVVAASTGSSQTAISRRESKGSRGISSSSSGEEFGSANKARISGVPIESNTLPGTKETERSSEIKPTFPTTFDSGSTLSPTITQEKKLTPEKMKEVDPVKANQISASDQAIKDLQRRLDESERQLKKKQQAGDQAGAAQLSDLISQMRQQREQMKNENEKLRKDMLEMMAAKENSRKAEAAKPARSIASGPSFAPTPSASTGQKSSSPVATPSSGGSGSFLPTNSSSLGAGGGSVSSPKVDDYGISGKGSFNQGPTLRLTMGELASARFVKANSNQDIFSAILSAPKEPVFVREDGIIVKYVAQLDEDGNPVLDKDGKPILTSYKFQDPEFDNKKVTDRKPAAVTKPVVIKERKFTKKWSEVESVIKDTVQPQ